jgi:hypothetical protein
MGKLTVIASILFIFWVAGNVTLDAVQRQIEEGAVEW